MKFEVVANEGQLIRAICEDPTDGTQVTLLYGNNTEADILL